MEKGVLIQDISYNPIGDKIEFNNINLARYGVLEKVDRNFTPGIRIKTKEIQGRNGVLYKGKEFEPLYIDIYLRLFKGINIGRLMNMIYKNTSSDKLGVLNYKDSKVFYDAVAVDYNIEESHRDLQKLIKITFLVPSGSGRSRSYVETESFTDKIVRLDGNLPTYPIFTFEGTGAKIYSYDNDGGEIIITTGVSRKFEIDSKNETVFANGSLDMKRLDWNSDFFMIYDGMRIRSTVPIKMKYYERYMYDED